MKGAKLKLEQFKEMGYPAIPTISECKSCKVKDCTSRMRLEDLELQKTITPLDIHSPVEVPVGSSGPF
jgi:hypothetical protein